MNQSLQKASDHLHVTRSAISQSLKALEEELGYRLFLRNSKNLKPTSQARNLFKVVDPFVADLQSTLHELDSDQKSLRGKIRIGAPMDFGSGILTDIIGRFRNENPQVSFELHLAVPLKQLTMLTAGDLDLAIVDNGDVHAGKYAVSTQTLLREEFVLAASEAFYKQHGLREVSFKTLQKLPVVDYLPEAPVARLWFRHHFGKDPAFLNIAFSAESVRAVLNAVRAGIGVGVVPDRLLQGEYKQLKVLETPRGKFVNQVVLARPLGRTPSMREKEFVEFLKSALR